MLQTLRQGRALDKLHDEGLRALALLHAEDRGDVGVVELGKQLRFALEALEALLVFREGCGQDLDRDVPLQLGVGRAVDLTHPALAQLGGDLVRA